MDATQSGKWRGEPLAELPAAAAECCGNRRRCFLCREIASLLSIARVYRPPVATVIRPHGQPVGWLGISEQYVSSISSFLGVEQGAVR